MQPNRGRRFSFGYLFLPKNSQIKSRVKNKSDGNNNLASVGIILFCCLCLFVIPSGVTARQDNGEKVLEKTQSGGVWKNNQEQFDALFTSRGVLANSENGTENNRKITKNSKESIAGERRLSIESEINRRSVPVQKTNFKTWSLKTSTDKQSAINSPLLSFQNQQEKNMNNQEHGKTHRETKISKKNLKQRKTKQRTKKSKKTSYNNDGSLMTAKMRKRSSNNDDDELFMAKKHHARYNNRNERIKRQNRRQDGTRTGKVGKRYNRRPPPSSLKLTNGLYEGLVIKIHQDIPEDDCRDVIQGLKASIRELSSALYVSTDGRAALGRVVVIIPHQWPARACHASEVESSESSFVTHDPQIFVNLPHKLFGDAPWTQQSAGCGEPGDFISLGVNFLKEANSSSELAIRAGRVLMGEWAKFRWGVFSEVGHSGDPLYPPWYLDNAEWTPTLCSDIKSHSLPCHPELSHRCPWPPKELVNATSSLLSTPNLPHVNLFCSRRTHNSRAPTKQNNLCRGRSAWDVITASHDFSGGRNPPGIAPLLTPSISFVKPSPLKFVLLVEDSAVMNEQKRWEFVRKAVRRTVVYDLPDGAYVSVVVFNSKPTEVAPLSKLESSSDLRERVGSSLPRNPSTVRASQACIKCALDAAVKVIKAAKLSEKGTNIVLLTSGDQSRLSTVEEVTNRIQNHGLKLLLVLYPFQEYPGRPAPTHALVPVARNSGGSIFTVMDEGVGNDSKVSMLVSLMEALTAAVSAGGAITPVLVHIKTYPGGVTSLSTGTFSLDDSLSANVKFAVYYYDLNHVGNTIHLTAPSGSMFASVSMQEEDGDVNMIFVNLHNAERGDWSYKVENRADSHQGLHIQVTSLTNPTNAVKIRVWTNQRTEIALPIARQTPIIIYGEVKVNDSPVIDAGVMAILQRLGTNATGGTYPAVKVALLDLGTGDPDITKGDGIYSRYAPPLEGPARYSVVLSVDARNAVIGQSSSTHEHDIRHHRHAYVKENYVKKASETSSSFPYSSSSFSYGLASSISSSFYSYYETPSHRGWENMASTMEPSGCCGSTLQFQHTRQSPPFTRQVSGSTLDSRTEYSQRNDITPPSRISDLISWVNSSTGMIVLEWTAVGTDYDWGRASRYEAAATYSLEQALLQCSGHVLKGLPEPSPASTKETVSLPLEINEKRTLYICIRAVDKAGNRGPPGNAAAVWLPRPPSMDRVTVRARGSGFGGYGASGLGEKAAVISGIIGGLLLVAIMVSVYCYCVPVAFRRRFKGRRQDINGLKAEEKSTANGPEGNLINGGSVIMKSQSRKSLLTATSSRRDGDSGDMEINLSQRKDNDHPSDGGSQETLKLCSNDEATTPKLPNGAADLCGSLNSGKRALSMSIPDVTRVDPQKGNVASTSQSKHSDPTQGPQFYTLGRHPSQRAAQRNPFLDTVGSNSSELQQQPRYGNSTTLMGAHKGLNEVSFQMMGGSNHAPTPLGTTNPFSNNGGFCPPTPNKRRSMHESDSSLYGSQEGDSEVLLCDDRNSSPPPPAPTGPEDPVAFRVNRHSVAYP